jgi:hypothetical protein
MLTAHRIADGRRAVTIVSRIAGPLPVVQGEAEY